MADRFDVLIVGAGIAGASVAADLSADRSVVLVEREAQAGYHSTGRSAALFSEIYGNAPIRALSRASRDLLFDPPPGFSERPLVSPRGSLYVARSDQCEALEAMAVQPDVAAAADIVDASTTRRLSPLLREGYAAAGLYEPTARDIDVDALHQGYLRRLRANGGRLLLGGELVDVERRPGGWLARLAGGEIEAAIIVNAAGAWADRVAALAGAPQVGLTPRRRTAVLVEAPDDATVAASPLTIDIDEQFYFKPDAGLVLISPADETADEACDVQPDEMDIAVAVSRVEAATSLTVRRIRGKWAGLRSFVDDRSPVVGFDPACSGFFWLAGQGGYGIQTSPAMGRLAAALIRGRALPAELADHGLRLADIAVERLDRRLFGLPGRRAG